MHPIEASFPWRSPSSTGRDLVERALNGEPTVRPTRPVAKETDLPLVSHADAPLTLPAARMPSGPPL